MKPTFGKKGNGMRSIVQGIRSNPWKLFVYFIAAFSVLWTIIEGLTYFIPSLDFKGILALLVVVGISVLYSVVKVRRPSSITFDIANTNTKIQIKFGDLFDEDGVRCIAVNEFFDSELGLPVSKKSLHGIFLSNCFGGHSDSFDKIVSEELIAVSSETSPRKQGKENRFEIGTTASIGVNSDQYLCFALTKTNTETLKAEADVPMLWKALEGLYGKARQSLGGAPLVLPLVGGGLSGIGLPARDLLDLLILSLIAETKKRQVATLFKIIITFDRYDEIDLTKVKQHWR